MFKYSLASEKLEKIRETGRVQQIVDARAIPYLVGGPSNLWD
ncbi:MAG: hypothetical protein SNJ78_13160 [Spirochaetales bacterium]